MFTKHSEHFLFSKWPFYLPLLGVRFFSLVLFVFVVEGWPIRFREVATTINVRTTEVPLLPLVGTISWD